MGRLEAIAAIKKHGPVKLLDVDEVPDEWTVAPICGVGAPSVSLEKGTNGREYGLVRDMMERMLGRKLDAFLLSEAGGMNSMIPISAAARAGLPSSTPTAWGALSRHPAGHLHLERRVHQSLLHRRRKGKLLGSVHREQRLTEEIGRAITTACGGR